MVTHVKRKYSQSIHGCMRRWFYAAKNPHKKYPNKRKNNTNTLTHPAEKTLITSNQLQGKTKLVGKTLPVSNQP
jgi:hypothetical protein